MINLKVRILVSGAAGSIGASTLHYLRSNHEVLGVDNYSNYYSTKYKNERVEHFKLRPLVRFIDLCDYENLNKIFTDFSPEIVIHLAARPGVRANFNDLNEYIDSNLIGFVNIAKLSKEFEVTKFIYASSSSVYTSNNQKPFDEKDILYYPKSFYAITKQSNEMMATYFASESTKFLGMRFFTVYGPWGRPDMAVLQFLGKSIKGIKSKFNSELTIQRDFTFIDDVTKIIGEAIDFKLASNYEIINVGGSSPRTMSDLINIMEQLGLNLKFDIYPPSNEDTKFTHASIHKLEDEGFTVPNTSLEEGIRKTYDWLVGQKSSAALDAILELNN
jgi:UDP-glucuronate 4-epimerase